MNKQPVYDFAKAIGEHDIDKICSLMTVDHKFVDAHGNEVIGKEKVKAGWKGYLELFDETIAAFGFANGTYKGKTTDNNENYWRLPASWKAIVSDNKIKLWQVYADTKIPFDIIDKNK
jgi:hypothetical protein